MTAPTPEGLAQSIKQRLLNLSQQRGEVFNIVLMRFAAERMLYRLSSGPHADQFVLKGAMLFSVWTERPHRPTLDVDLLGFGLPSEERLAAIFRDVCVAAVEPDGLDFDADSVTVEPIREEAEYDGLRVRLLTRLGTARVPLQIDVGFGDVISPAPRELELGPMLQLPPPRLRTYPPETVIAEKLDAIIQRGMTNSRMKDYFDLWTMSRTMSFSFVSLRTAIVATAERRRTEFPQTVPTGLTDEFASDSSKLNQWKGFTRKMGVADTSPTLRQVVDDVAAFLAPVVLETGGSPREWPPGGPWRATP